MTRVKICGITNFDDALTAAELGADMLGFVFAESRRRISPETAKRIVETIPPFITTVGVFMNQPVSEVDDVAGLVRLHAVQLHGAESPKACDWLSKKRNVIKRIPVRSGDTAESLEALMAAFRACTFLLDPGAGNGRTFDWRQAKGIGRPVIVAGGLTPQNVREVVRLLRPAAVDVSSGVEKEPGIKDPEKMKAFILEAR
jgi:phosphoribosylanthranilate isomerase